MHDRFALKYALSLYLIYVHFITQAACLCNSSGTLVVVFVARVGLGALKEVRSAHGFAHLWVAIVVGSAI